MCRTNVDSPALATATEDDANHALLGCWNILNGLREPVEKARSRLTRRALPSTHHRLLLAEWCSWPARVDMMGWLFGG